MNHLNPRGRKVVAREAGLLNLVREFDDLPLLQQNQIETIVNYCTNCAFVSVVAQILPTVEKPDEDQLDLDHSDLDVYISNHPIEVNPELTIL